MIKIKIFIIMLLNICGIYSQQLDSALYKAYKYNSKIILDEFFMNWQRSNELNDKEIAKIEEQINADETLKTVIEIANTFYKHVSTGSTFFILSDTLTYYKCNTDSVISCNMNFLTNAVKRQFAPYRIPYYSDNVLYLSEKYINSLNSLFRNDYDYNTYEKMEEKLMDYESKKTFLSGKISFQDRVGSSISNYFYYYTVYSKPQLGTITLNDLLNEAIMFIMTSSNSFFTELWVKEDGNWLPKKVLTEGGF